MNSLDPHVAFGLFTYERPTTGAPDNPAREIDWLKSHAGVGTPPFFVLRRMATAAGKWASPAGMVYRYRDGMNAVVTLVMKWRPGQVTFD
jgi:hypothetical protein